MDNNRMSTSDMLQYCNEALAWDDFGPVDIFFFESVKKIILGQCSAFDSPDDEDVIEDLMGIERPVRDVELEPDYDKYADIYYGEEGDDEVPDYSLTDEDKAFSDVQFSDGFFDENAAEGNGSEGENAEGSAAESESAPEGENAAETAAEPVPKKAAAKKTKKKKQSAAKAAQPENTENTEPAEESAPEEPAADGGFSEENKHEENTSGSFTVNI